MNQSPSLAEIVNFETQVWEALRLGDPALDATLLSDDFIGVYPTGVSTNADHCDQLKNGPTIARYAIKEPRITIINEDCVILSYLAELVRIGSNTDVELMYISSMWKRFGDRWLNIFSQDTPTS